MVMYGVSSTDNWYLPSLPCLFSSLLREQNSNSGFQIAMTELVTGQYHLLPPAVSSSAVMVAYVRASHSVHPWYSVLPTRYGVTRCIQPQALVRGPKAQRLEAIALTAPKLPSKAPYSAVQPTPTSLSPVIHPPNGQVAHTPYCVHAKHENSESRSRSHAMSIPDHH